MSRTSRRDHEFAAFVDENAGSLRRYCLLLTGSPAQADDLLQDSLVKLYLAWQRIDAVEAREAYARRIITRTQISWWRSRQRGEVPVEVLPERAPSTASDEQRIADQDEVWRLLATLGPRQRAVLVLRFYEDLPLADIAAHLGCSLGTAKSQLSRGLEHLRRELTFDDPVPPLSALSTRPDSSRRTPHSPTEHLSEGRMP